MIDLIVRVDLAMQTALWLGNLILATKLAILWATLVRLHMRGMV